MLHIATLSIGDAFEVKESLYFVFPSSTLVLKNLPLTATTLFASLAQAYANVSILPVMLPPLVSSIVL